MARLLIVEDEQRFSTILQQILESRGHSVSLHGNVSDALEECQGATFDLVVSDIRMEPLSGLVLLGKLVELQPQTPVVMMTAFATVDSAMEALKMGAFDYITKPFKLDEFLALIDRALAAGAEEHDISLMKLDECIRFGRVVCASEAMREACRMIELVAPTDAAVLLSGEPGTGRAFLAQVLREKSLRCEAPCVTVDCRQIDPNVSAEAFLGVPGRAGASPAGASPADDSLLATAGGTAIIENVDALPRHLQEILLAVIQDKSAPIAGAASTAELDLRVVATTDAELNMAVVEGRFMHALFARLGLIEIRTPPLRKRREDILPLVWHTLRASLGDRKPFPDLSSDAQAVLWHYGWPGNIPELEDAVGSIVTGGIERVIGRDDLPLHILQKVPAGLHVPQEEQPQAERASTLKSFLRAEGVEVEEDQDG